MNTFVLASVSVPCKRPRYPTAWHLAVLLVLLQGFGCVAIEGGAAELSWSLRTFEGESLTCKQAQVEEIRLCWNALDSNDSGCRPNQSRRFTCKEATGVTRFEIEPGRTKLFAEPVCADGLPAAVGTFQAPAEIVRTVEEGQIVTLDSLLILVTDQDLCAGVACTCAR